MKTIVITGVTSGLGKEIARLLNGPDNYIIGLVEPRLFTNGNYIPVASRYSCNHLLGCDLTDLGMIDACCQLILETRRSNGVDILINCAGVNEINWLEDVKVTEWMRVMDINARSIFLLSQGLLSGLIAAKGTILNIISNASHMPMTASLVYNASKGAAHIMTLQLARELTRTHEITVFGISPNKMSGTEMSKYIESRVPEVRGWSPEEARKYQDSALLAGETDPVVLAEFIAYLLYNKRNHQYLTGCVIPYGA